jgi:1-acyl-sn-glycerol-3-phosphate acyltransferase
VTALYALDRLARLAPGERVLIHSATGGVGMAALQVARRAGAEVLATAGSDDKRELLRSLGVEHVFDSRSLDFATEVMDVTGGAGVDVVLNSLSGEAIARGIETLAPFGRFVELGKRDIYAGSNLGLLAFRRNLSFFAVDLDRLCSERPDLAGELLVEVAALLADGTFEALPSRVFPVGETEEALRLMAQARHVGKITVAMDGSQEIEARPPRCHPDGTYLVTGGTGGFGMATAAWLVDQGAGAVVVVARRPPDEVTARRLGELRATGAEVVAMTADVGVEAQVARLLDDVRRTLPPLRGVVHAAMVLDDAPLDQLDRARLTTGMQAKVLGAWNLHRLTRSDDLDMFVCYSSIAALLGNAGQGGYAAANAFLEALAHHRRALGLEALTVDWGVISEVGYVSRRHDLARHLERQGYRSFTPDQALATLDRLLGHDDPQAMAARIDWGRWATALPDETRSTRLGHFAPAPDSAPAASGVMQQVLALPEAERLDGVVASVRREVGGVLGVNAARLDLDRRLADLGLDSLIAVELVAVLQLRLGVEVPLVRLLQDTTVTGLAELVLELAEASGTTRRAVPDRAPAEAPAPAAVAATGAAAMPSAPQAGPPSSAASSPPPAPGPIPTNGAGDADAAGRKRYQDLDHRRWSPSQRAVKALISTGLRSVLSVEVEGREHLMTPGPYVLATNHLALVDVPLVLTVMPRPVIVMAASDYRSSWLFDWFLSDMGNAIYVDRGTGDLEALERALTVLRSGGVVGLSPEGRRSPSGALERAHAGVAHLAARSGAPVVPMAVWGQEAARATLRRGRRAPVTIRTGAPLAPPRAGAPPAELSAFSDQVMTTIASLLPERYRGVYATGAAHAGVIGNGA